VVDGLVTAMTVGSLLLVVTGVLSSVINRPPGLPHLVIAALLEIAVVAQAAVACVRLVGGADVNGLALFLAYLAFCVVVLPIGALYAVEERTRWSGVVLAVASLALIVTLYRLDSVWVDAGA